MFDHCGLVILLSPVFVILSFCRRKSLKT